MGLVDLKVLFEANLRCNELGMDPDSLGFTLSMAMECAQEKVYTAEQVEIDLRFGDGQAMLAAIDLIAYRRGFGAVLAEGAKRAADMIGGGAERFALHVKGLEMVPFEPRTQTNLALGYAVAPIGPRYDICEHDWDFDTRVGWAHTLEHSRTLGILDRIPMEQLSVEKVRNYKALATIWSGADALDFCIFAIAPTRVFSLQEMADMLAAVTGWDTSAYEIMRWGERRLHLMRLYNLGAGLTAADDTLPARFFDEPIHEGDWAGTRLDRARFEEAVRTYYFMMGWDLDGRPRRETLIDHHLEWATWAVPVACTPRADGAVHMPVFRSVGPSVRADGRPARACRLQGPAAQREHGGGGEQVLEAAGVDAHAAVEIDLADDLDVDLPAEEREVGDGEELAARGFVPLLRQVDGDRDMAREEQLQAAAPVAPVGEADDRLPADAQHLAQDHGRVVQERQRLAEDHPVEAGVRIVGQALLQVALAHAQPAAHAGQHPLFGDLDAAALDLSLAHQILEQGAVATAKVKHAGARHDQVGDGAQVRAQGRGHGGLPVAVGRRDNRRSGEWKCHASVSASLAVFALRPAAPLPFVCRRDSGW